MTGARRTVDTRTFRVPVQIVETSGDDLVVRYRNRSHRMVKVGPYWRVSTRSLCERSLGWSITARHCEPRFAQPNEATCLVLVSVVGRCRSAVDPSLHQIVVAYERLSFGNPAQVQRHLNSWNRPMADHLSRRGWHLPIIDIERNGQRATVTIDHWPEPITLDVVYRLGSWRFTPASICRTGFVGSGGGVPTGCPRRA